MGPDVVSAWKSGAVSPSRRLMIGSPCRFGSLISAFESMGNGAGRGVAGYFRDGGAGQEGPQLLVGARGAERAEGLARAPLGEVDAQQALHRLGHRAGGNPVADGPGHRLVPADRAAHAEVVGIHQAAVHLDLLALDADVGDPVLAAAIGAAGDVDADVLLEAGQPRLQVFHEPAGEALGLGQRELAELAPRAGHGAAAERGGVQPEAGAIDRALELARARGTLTMTRFCMVVVLSSPVPKRSASPARPRISSGVSRPRRIGRPA